jgi:hypothetical protein
MELLSGSTDHSRSESNEVAKIIFQSTCHLAMESCNNNYHCKLSLNPILLHCDMSRCNRNSCMEALQSFYRKPTLPWNVEIAFCLCKYALFHYSPRSIIQLKHKLINYPETNDTFNTNTRSLTRTFHLNQLIRLQISTSTLYSSQ